jgi:hypothetical protein
MKIWRLMGEYDAETTTYSACAGTPASPFTPDFSGRLIGLRTIASGSAVTSLTRHIEFRLTCAKWQPNTIEVGVQGSGLETAPLNPSFHKDWEVDQEVVAGVPITIEARNITAATPITVESFIYGLFEIK